MKRTPLVVMPWRDIFHVECTPQMCGEDDCICDYLAGYIPPRYPVPALMTDSLYWRMKAYPTNELIAQWYLWNQGYRKS